MQNNPVSSIGFIMDGNRRWATEQGLDKTEGHKHGREKLFEVAEWCRDLGIKSLVVYAFSTENWQRTDREVETLLGLIESLGDPKYLKRLKNEGARVVFAGQKDRFSKPIQKVIGHIEKETADGDLDLYVCLSYGGRAEIVAAANAAARAGESELTEESFEKYLWTAGLCDPQIIVRTGGSKRLSNFLLWKAAYSEIYFTPTKWPAIGREEIEEIIADYRDNVLVNKGT